MIWTNEECCCNGMQTALENAHNTPNLLQLDWFTWENVAVLYKAGYPEMAKDVSEHIECKLCYYCSDNPEPTYCLTDEEIKDIQFQIKNGSVTVDCIKYYNDQGLFDHALYLLKYFLCHCCATCAPAHRSFLCTDHDTKALEILYQELWNTYKQYARPAYLLRSNKRYLLKNNWPAKPEDI
jgi:hypothetical protein